MRYLDFINAEESFKIALHQYIQDCIEYDIHVQDRLLDCIRGELIENDLDEI